MDEKEFENLCYALTRVTNLKNVEQVLIQSGFARSTWEKAINKAIDTVSTTAGPDSTIQGYLENFKLQI